MLSTLNTMNKELTPENDVPSAKRRRLDDGKVSSVSSMEKRKQGRRVRWAERTEYQQQDDFHKLFKDYNEKDIWYTVSFFENDALGVNYIPYDSIAK